MATKFEVLLSAKLDENSVKDIQRQLDSISKGTTLKINADSSSVDKLKQSLNEVTNAANNAKKGGQGLDDIVGKFASWQVVGDVIHGVKNAMEDMVQQVFDLDESLVELEKVTDLSKSSLDELADKAFEVGEKIGATGKDVIDATSIFAQAGFEAKDALDLGEQAIMLQNVSEAGATATGSAQTLIAAMKAFNLESTQSNHIVDALNEVSNKYAVSVNDLSTAIQKSSASMAAGNNTLEQTFGLVAAGTEILQEPGRVANGLGTITARLTAKNDEYIKSITKGQGVLDAQTGELRSTFDILWDLSKAWSNLTSVEQQELAETVAGKTQRSLFTAIMTNFDTAVGATEAALNSEGSAAQENTKRMESMQGRLTQLQSAWQDFARNTINSEAVKSVISLGTQIIKLADTDIGRLIIMLVAAKTAMMLFNKVMATEAVISLGTALKSYLINYLSAVIISFKAATISGTVFGGALAALGTTIEAIGAALLTNPLFLAIAAFGALTTIISNVNKKAEEAREASKALSEEYLNQASEAQDLLDKYDELSKKTNKSIKDNQELENTIEDLSKKYGVSEQALKSEGAERDKSIKKIKEEIAERKKAAAVAAEAGIKWKKTGFLSKFGVGKSEKDIVTNREMVEVQNDLNKSYDLTGATLAEVQKKTQGYITELQNKSNKTKEEKDDLKDLLSIYKRMTDSINTYKEGYKQANENFKEGIPITTEEANALYKLGEITLNDALAVQSYNDWVEKNKDATDEQKEAIYEILQAQAEHQNQIENNTESTDGLTEAQKRLKETLTYTKEELDAINEDIDNTQSAYATLTSAVDEYNSSGGISMDTLQQLLALDGEYLSSLELIDGKLQISQEAQNNHAQAMQTDTLALIENAAMQDLQAMATEGAGSVASEAASKVYKMGEKSKQAGDFAREGAAGFRELANAMSDAGMVDKNAVNVDAWANKWSGITEKIKGLTSGTSMTGSKFTGASGGKKSKGGGGSKKSAASTKEEYKAEIDLLYGYKNALDIAKDSVDRYKDALKSTENFKEQEKYLKKLIDATNNQINKTNELKNAQTGQINDYINQLRAQGFAIDYNNSTNELYINNMQHLADFSGDTAKNLEKLIKKIQDLNDDNRSLDGSVRDLTDDVKDYYDQLADIPEKKLKKFKELMEDFQQSRLDQVENQIQDIEHDLKNDERLKALQDQIDALEKQKEELEDQETIEEKLLAVEEAKIKLANAQKQKTLQVYREGQGFVWEADPDAIADAAEELADAQKDLNDQVLQDQIDNLQAEYDAIEKSYQDRIDALQDFLDEQNYIIDKSNREGIQSFEDLQAALRKYGLDSAEYLGQATDWLNNYNNALSNLDTTVNGILANSSAATDGLIYSSNMQDRINQALSTLVPSASPITGLTLSNIDYDRLKGSDNQTIYVNSIELPNVQNVDDFVAALKDLPRMATTQVTKRT